MTRALRPILFALAAVVAVGSSSFSAAQAASRGSVVVFPVIYDKSGTDTSRAKAKEAMNEIFKKGGFKVVEETGAAKTWSTKKFSTPTITRPPSKENLVSLGKSLGVKYVCSASVTFHTRSIWVNLGPKTISTCHITLTIVDSQTGKIVHEADAEGRSDEKSDNLKIAGAILISPLVTAVSGGPKTPQESRAAQIASARALEKFIIVE
jgi:hypothetical protein